ncbi:MAG: hypothetical protein QOD84_300 [Acidobacteriaceae bacterium]|jgi:hypothetical protein
MRTNAQIKRKTHPGYGGDRKSQNDEQPHHSHGYLGYQRKQPARRTQKGLFAGTLSPGRYFATIICLTWPALRHRQYGAALRRG